MTKVFKNITQQIEILERRGMIFGNMSAVREELKRKNYYNLINGMKELIIDDSDPSTEKYKNGLRFDEVLALFNFDKGLRTLFLKYILIVESEFRTHIAYEFSKSESPYSWDNPLAFEYTTVAEQNHVNNLIITLNTNASRTQRDSHDDMLNHFNVPGSKIPIWALINTFDFGTLKKFYINCKTNLRNTIANYYSLSASKIKGFLEALNMYRNVCAHDFRILFYRIYDINKRIQDTNIHNKLNLERNSHNEFIRGKGDLFSIVIVFKYMLSKKQFKMFYKELNKLVKTVKHNVKVISFKEILNSIGFPLKTNTQLVWKKIKKIEK